MSERFSCWIEIGLMNSRWEQTLRRWIELPFVPFPGLWLNLNGAEAEGREEVPPDWCIVRLVEWNVPDECFWLTAEDWDQPKESDQDLKESIAHFVDMGWEKVGKRSRRCLLRNPLPERKGVSLTQHPPE